MNINTRENIKDANRIPDYVQKIMELIEGSGFNAYVAGGAVRDIALGKEPHDYDVATSALPGETIEIFKNAGIEYFDTGAKHGTVTAVTSGGNVEVTTFREDGEYSDLRRPDEVVFKTTIEEDVRRRDFTINAMYMDRDGRICVKWYGGKLVCQFDGKCYNKIRTDIYSNNIFTDNCFGAVSHGNTDN